MRRRLFILALALTAPALLAQRHGGRSAPPTAPPAAPLPPPVPVVPVSSGLGAIQFVQVNYGVPAPQSLTRQLRFDDERTRLAALSAIGAPGQYQQHGRVPMPRSVELTLVPLGNSDDLDALLTVELDQHLVTAVLIPVDGNWRRIATLIFPTPFENANTTPTTWLRTARSLVQKDRYRAIFRASTGSIDSNFAENEAHLRIINNKAVITLSFESTARECLANPPANQPAQSAPKLAAPQNATAKPAPPRPTVKPGCNITQRWFQPDPAEPTKHFELVSATGHLSPKDLEDPLASSRTMMMAHLRNFACQPFLYSETTQHYEPAAPNGPCKTK